MSEGPREELSEAEIAHRRDDALRRALNTPPVKAPAGKSPRKANTRS